MRKLITMTVGIISALLVIVGPNRVAAEKPPASHPNILFIYTDDQGPTTVGALGNGEIHTPNLDRLFRSGATLTQAMVTTPVCSPARATLLTSRYGSEWNITDWINPRSEVEKGLDPKAITWVQILRDAGYHTGLVGKWHLGVPDRFHPHVFGYDYFFGFREGGAKVKNPRLESDEGEIRQYEGLTVDLLTNHSLQFLEQHHTDPFCLCVHYRSPHAAWLPVAPEDWAPYENLDPKLPDPNWPDLNTKKVKRMTREYYASISGVDRNVGRLLEKLEALGIDQQTIIIFTSDHGYHRGHQGLWYKGNAHWVLNNLPEQQWPNISANRRPNLFDQALRVPTAVRWPRVTNAGDQLSQVVTNLDWFPTLLAMAGVPMPDGAVQQVRGRDFTPLLQGLASDWDNSAYFEYSMKHGAKTHMRAWRTNEWKLILDFKNPGRGELYHLPIDPEEKKNLFTSTESEVQSARERLEAKIRNKMREIEDPLAQTFPHAIGR